MQLKVVWSLLLQAGSEGPPLIFHVPSWRTYTYKSSDLSIKADCRLPLESKWQKFLLDGRKHPRDRTLLWDRLPEKHPQGLPSTTTQFRKEW
jgi:hypothetical protein